MPATAVAGGVACWDTAGRKRPPSRFTSAPLDKLALTGNVNVSVPRLTTQALRIGASGGATLTIGDLQATTLRVDGSGALKAELAGHVDDEHLSISGAGSYRAERLRAGNATVSVSGVANVVVNVERM